MIALAFALSLILIAVTFALRAAGASLVRTPRADALSDAAGGKSGAARVADLLEERARLQPALGPAITGLVTVAVIPATWAFSRLFSGIGLVLVLAVMVPLIVLLTDLLPRVVGRSSPRTLAYRFARLLVWAVWLGDAANDLISDVDEEDDGAGERELISSVLDFGDTIVREVMVPRTDMVTLPSARLTDEALDLVLDAGKSRIPITREGIDDVVGVLYARDLLKIYDQEGPTRPSGEIARPPYFVPETKRISQLLRDMQANQVHMAIVVDEFGGTAGLVTIEDLLEEIVGEIADEYDREEPMVVPIDGGGYLVDARLDVDTLADLLGTSFPDAEWDTVGGLVLGLAGRVPREGEEFDYDDLTLVADRVQGRRVAKVRVGRR